jgi:hypothetical protein
MADLATQVYIFGLAILVNGSRCPSHLGAIYLYRQESSSSISQGVLWFLTFSMSFAHGTLAGLIKAGLHEVVVNARTIDVINKRRVEFPERPLIRISSTFFWHLSSDVELQPIPELKERADTLRELNHEEADDYPTMKVGEQVQKYVCSSLLIAQLRMISYSELRHIALMA